MTKKSKVKKSGKKQKVSEGLRRYWELVRQVQRDWKLETIAAAREIYATRVSIKPDRYKRIAYDDLANRPKYIKVSDAKKYGKWVRKRRKRGFQIPKGAQEFVIYWDTLRNEPVKAIHALKAKRKAQVSRLAFRMMEVRWSDLRRVHKYFPESARRRKTRKKVGFRSYQRYITKAEALSAAKKIMKARRKDRRLWRWVFEKFGES